MNTDADQLVKLGSHMKSLLSRFIADRSLVELQWLKNLRQYNGTYDPDVIIPAERSKAYPRDTRRKIRGCVAKLMEMMFPSQDRNWGLEVSPNPDIPQDALQEILNILQAQGPVSSDAIEREVRAFAEKRRDKMEAEIADQLADSEVDYPQLCKSITRSGYVYGFGVARAPMVRTQQERVWQPAPTGYVAETRTVRRPYPEHVRIWDLYPDLSAKKWGEQETIFERMVLTRHDFAQLAKRPDFKEKPIKDYLRDHVTGNYKAQPYETELDVIAKATNISERTSRRYEIYRALGFVSAHELQGAGVPVKDSELDQDILADIWFIDDVIIKADKAAFGEKPSDQYHAFIYAEDEDSGLTGMGLPEEIRDSQMGLCASTRCLMDNMAATAGPMWEVNTSLLPVRRKQVGPIHSFMVIEREGEGVEAQYPAVRPIQVQSHVPELLNIISNQRQQLDIESNMPDYTLGAAPQQPLGEAFRTTSNMSMLMGSANMVTKDVVRAFDKFSTSLIGSMLLWNMEFNPKEDIKGDYQVSAKGVQSLVAKEIRGAALDQFMTTLTPQERAVLDEYGLLIDRLKARDLPTNRVLPREEAEQVLKGMQESASRQAEVEQGLTAAKTASANASAEKTMTDARITANSSEAVIQEILSRVESNLANAQSSASKTQLENIKTLLSTAAAPKEAM
jgi:hypothetical protein